MPSLHLHNSQATLMAISQPRSDLAMQESIFPVNFHTLPAFGVYFVPGLVLRGEI